MKKLLKMLVLLIAALVVAVAGGAYLIPEVTVVQRQVVIQAPPATVFALVGNLKRFKEWSPWAELDPAMTISFEGPDSGLGQKMLWDSADPNVGKGSLTVVEFVENSKVVSELDLGDMGKAPASLLLVPVDGGTGVTWGVKITATGVIDRWMSLMFDRWIGADYEKGLAKLKAVAEKEAAGG